VSCAVTTECRWYYRRGLGTWLDPTNEDIKGLQKLLVPAPAKAFEAYPVSTRVNKVANDRSELIEPNPEPDHS
jgi:putative SOS response-associated peptidase YedK